MSVSVKYKGSEILSIPSGGDYKLSTAGKYLEDDIRITDSGGGSAAVVVTEEPDINGGVIKNITAVDISEDSVDAAHLLQGYTAHDRYGNPVSGGYVAPQTQTKSVSPTESQQTVTPDSGKLLSSVTVDAIPSTYVGSDIPRRSSSDLTASGAVVTVPEGIYTSEATKSVTSGSAGVPTASKGSVSNHAVAVTPSVTNSTGYITGGTKTGTPVTVSASELVSGSQTITENGTVDVTNLASVNVAIPIVTYYTGSSTPSQSLGSNGDIYLKTT